MTNDYDHNIHSNPDAMAWAKFFMETIKKNKCTIDNIDEGLMVAWFANAMMAIHDHIYQTKNVSEKTTPDIATLQKQLADAKAQHETLVGAVLDRKDIFAKDNLTATQKILYEDLVEFAKLGGEGGK